MVILLMGRVWVGIVRLLVYSTCGVFQSEGREVRE